MVDRLKRCKQKPNELTLKRLSRVIGVEIGGVREISWRKDSVAGITDYTRDVRATYRALLMQIRLLHGENLRSLLSVAEGLVLAQERITQVDSFVIEQDEAPI